MMPPGLSKRENSSTHARLACSARCEKTEYAVITSKEPSANEVGGRGLMSIESAIGERRSRSVNQNGINVHALEVVGLTVLQEEPQDPPPRAAEVQHAGVAVHRAPELTSISLHDREEDECFSKRLLPCRTNGVRLQQVVGEAGHANTVDDRFREASHQERQPLVVIQRRESRERLIARFRPAEEIEHQRNSSTEVRPRGPVLGAVWQRMTRASISRAAMTKSG